MQLSWRGPPVSLRHHGCKFFCDAGGLPSKFQLCYEQHTSLPCAKPATLFLIQMAKRVMKMDFRALPGTRGLQRSAFNPLTWHHAGELDVEEVPTSLWAPGDVWRAAALCSPTPNASHAHGIAAARRRSSESQSRD